MHSQRKEIGSLSAYRVLDAREIRELNSEGFVLEHKKTGAMPGTDRMALLAFPISWSTASSAVQKNSR